MGIPSSSSSESDRCPVAGLGEAVAARSLAMLGGFVGVRLYDGTAFDASVTSEEAHYLLKLADRVTSVRHHTRHRGNRAGGAKIQGGQHRRP
jgi:hypothetical protein